MADSELTAVVDVQRLQARYAHAVDARDGDAIARLFTPDGVFDGDMGPLNGREEVKRFFEGLPQSEPPMRHHIGSIDVRFDDDGTLRYVDEYEPDADGGWLFKWKTIRIESRERA